MRQQSRGEGESRGHTTYLDGVIDHRDEFLTEEQRRIQVMPCVSRAHSRLIVLDP